MKKLLFISLISIALISCSSSDESNNLTNTPKEYTVSLGLSGEITNITTTPLSKAASTSSDLYGIQVYSCPTTNSTPTYSYYAYGLFDNTSNMTIKLLQGYIYKFVCTMIVGGKTKLYNNNNLYSAPFWITTENCSGNSVENNNQFTYSTTSYFVWINQGYSDDTTGKAYNRLNVDRYYGELTNFAPTDNESATISMKRVVFGAKFIGDGLTEGKLKISMADAPDIYITYPNTTIQDIFTFKNSNYYSNSMAWTQDDYTEPISTSITWIKADGAIVPLATQDISFKRNMLTTITVKVNDSSTTNGVNINTENVNMGDGGSVSIDSGTSGNTGVNPNQ